MKCKCSKIILLSMLFLICSVKFSLACDCSLGDDWNINLLDAIWSGDPEEVRVLLKSKGSHDIDAIGMDAITALMLASRDGHTEIVKLLIDAGALVNTETYEHGYTALYLASMKGHLEVVKLLIANGADVNASAAGYGWSSTALMEASSNGHTEIVKLLKDSGAK